MVTHAHLGPIWYHSEPSDLPYSPNHFLGWDFFCRFLQQDGSSYKTCFNPNLIFLRLVEPPDIARKPDGTKGKIFENGPKSSKKAKICYYLQTPILFFLKPVTKSKEDTPVWSLNLLCQNRFGNIFSCLINAKLE